MSHPAEPQLSGLRILVVDDELLICEMISDAMQDVGCDIVGPATSEERGKILADSETLDGAFLDINLAGKLSFSVAEILARRGVPFVFLTGYNKTAIPETYRQVPTLWKPFQIHELLSSARRHFTKATPQQRA